MGLSIILLVFDINLKLFLYKQSIKSFYRGCIIKINFL
jgi:hypothetical protein